MLWQRHPERRRLLQQPSRDGLPSSGFAAARDAAAATARGAIAALATTAFALAAASGHDTIDRSVRGGLERCGRQVRNAVPKRKQFRMPCGGDVLCGPDQLQHATAVALALAAALAAAALALATGGLVRERHPR